MNSDTLGHRFGAGSLSGHATGTVTSSIGKETMKAISADKANALFHYSALDAAASEALGPSDFYLRTGRLEFGPAIATDLLYRPSDRISLDDIRRAQKMLAGASVNYANGTGAIPTEKQGAAKSTLSQVGGDHYAKLAIDPFDYAMANKLDPLQMTVVKYVTRFRDKGGVQDLRKAIHTLERLIAHEEGRK